MTLQSELRAVPALRACIVSEMSDAFDSDDRASNPSGESIPEWMPFVYRELHQIARRLMRGERLDHTLQPTALVHEAYVRLLDRREVGADELPSQGAGDGDDAGERPRGFEERLQFKRAAVRAMRNALVDHARSRKSDKRGGQRRPVTFHEDLHAAEHESESLLLIDDALSQLEVIDEQLARIAELRFFGGLTHSEIAEALETSLRSVERGWRLARAWLITAFAED